MEIIKAKPIEVFKNIIIALLTASMLVLAGLYIGGSQFATDNAAINTVDMPDGAVALGNDAPKTVAIYEKDLLSISFAAIDYHGGGGAYGTMAAARDLFAFAKEPIHELLSSGAKISKSSEDEFERAVQNGKYIFISLTSPLPYQTLYALTGDFSAAAGSDSAISAKALLLSFENAVASLYIKANEGYFVATRDYSVATAELSAMASDSRLFDFEIKTNAVGVSNESPHAQLLTVTEGQIPTGQAYADLLTLLGYSVGDVQPTSEIINVVAPHGTTSFAKNGLIYTASKDSGLAISNFLDQNKNTLDISYYDVLCASVSLVEKLQNAYPEMTGAALSLKLCSFYHKDDTYTVFFGLSDSEIAIEGEAFPHLAKLTVSGGKFKSIELNFIGVLKSGKTASPFPSLLAHTYAQRKSDIDSLSLRYNVNAIPNEELDAHWYYTEADK